MSTASSPLFLGLDSGTQSAKAGIWDAAGTCLARGSRSLTVRTPHEGWAEQDPSDWWTSAAGAVAEAVSQVDASRLAAMGVSFQRETFALFDDDRKAVRPAVLWLDIRCADEVEEAGRRVDADGYHRRTGKPLDVTSAIPRMLWLARHEPQLLARASRWLDVGAFLNDKLTGIPGTVTAGADTSGLVDARARWWAPDHLAACGLERLRMPGLFEPGSRAGLLTREAARATGLPAGLPVIAGGGDGQCLAVGLGAAAGTGFTLTLGTSVVLGVQRAELSISPLYRTLLAARPDRAYLLESVIQTGTYILKWFEQAFPGPEAEVAGVPRGSDGLLTVPHWWGVRFPESLPDARGATVGWSHRHTRAHFLRSILEGVAFELRKLADDYRAALGVPARITACGGGARSRSWLQILADVIACPIDLSPEPEPAALGAAMLAAGPHAGAALVRPGETVSPDDVGTARYEAIYRGSYLPLREFVLERWRQPPAS